MSAPDDIDRIIFGEDKPTPPPYVVTDQDDEIDRIIFGPPPAPGKPWSVGDLAGKARERILEPALETVKYMGAEAKRGLKEAVGPAIELAPGAIIGGALGGLPGAAVGSAADFAISGAIGATKGAIWGSPTEDVSARMRRGILDFSPSAALLNKMSGGETPPMLPDSWQATAGEPDVERLGAGPIRGKPLSEPMKRMLLDPRLGEEDRIQEGALTREEIDARRQEMYDSPISDLIAGGVLTGGAGLVAGALRGAGRAAKRQVPAAIQNLTPKDVAVTTTGREAGFPASIRRGEATQATIEKALDDLQDLARTQQSKELDALIEQLDEARMNKAVRGGGDVPYPPDMPPSQEGVPQGFKDVSRKPGVAPVVVEEPLPLERKPYVKPVAQEAAPLPEIAVENTLEEEIKQYVKDSGGIRGYRKSNATGKGYMEEEIGEIPLTFRNRAGMAADQMAEEVNSQFGTQLYGDDLVQILKSPRQTRADRIAIAENAQRTKNRQLVKKYFPPEEDTSFDFGENTKVAEGVDVPVEQPVNALVAKGGEVSKDVKVPILLETRRPDPDNYTGSMIWMRFDISGKVLTAEELQTALNGNTVGAQVHVSRNAPNFISATRGDVSYRVDVTNARGSDDPALAAAMYDEMIAPLVGEMHRNPSRAEREIPLKDRFGFAFKYGKTRAEAESGWTDALDPNFGKNRPEANQPTRPTETLPRMEPPAAVPHETTTLPATVAEGVDVPVKTVTTEELAKIMDDSAGPGSASRQQAHTEADLVGSIPETGSMRNIAEAYDITEWEKVRVDPRQVNLGMDNFKGMGWEKEYAQLPAKTMPPVVLLDNNGQLAKLDGAHRILSAIKRGDETIEAWVPKGSNAKGIVRGVDVPVEQPVGRTTDPNVPRETLPSRPASQSVVSGEIEPNWPDALLEPETGGVPLSKLEKVGQKWSGFWDQFSTLPEGEKYQAIRNATRGWMGRAESFIDDIFKKMERLTSDQKKQLFEYLDARLTLKDLDQEVRPLANSLRRTNNMIGRMLVKRGLISEEVYQKHKNAYIHYMYLKHVLGDDAKIFKGGVIGALDLGMLKKRIEKMTLEERRAIGLIEDASITAPVGMLKALRNVGTIDMMNEVIKNPEWVWPGTVVPFEGRNIGIGTLAEELQIQRKIVKTAPNVPEAQSRLKVLEDLMDKAEEAASLAPEDFKKMPTSSSFGPLAGAFVRKEIYADLVPMDAGMQNVKDFSTTLYYLQKANEKSMSVYKVAHTAANIPTVARNVVSNVVQLNMSGIPLWEVPVYMYKALRSALAGDKLYTLAKRGGLFESNFSKGELRNGIDIIKTMQGGAWNKIVRGSLKLTELYGKVDDFYKLAKFIEQMEKKVGVEKAIIEANKWGMDYSVAHPLIKSARQNIMPFASYQYKIYPLIVESLAKNPITILKYMLIPKIAYGIARKTLDLSDSEWKRLNKELPEFIKQNRTDALLPIRSPEGRAAWVHREYYLPWQQPLALARDIKEGKWGDVVGKDLGIQHPVLDMYAIGKMMRGDEPPTDPFSKRPLYNRLDTPAEKALGVAEWLYNQYTPSMVQRHGVAGKVKRAITGEQDRAGTIMTPGKAAASLVGFNVIAPDSKAAFKEREAKLYRLEKDRVEALKRPNLSQEKRQQIWDEYRKRKKELLTEED